MNMDSHKYLVCCGILKLLKGTGKNYQVFFPWEERNILKMHLLAIGIDPQTLHLIPENRDEMIVIKL